MRLLAGLVLAVVCLSGVKCTTKDGTPIIVHDQVLAEIPADYLVCLQVHYPRFDTLTDKQVARLIVELASANAQCHTNMQAVKLFQDEVRKRIAAANKKGSSFGSSPVFQP